VRRRDGNRPGWVPRSERVCLALELLEALAVCASLGTLALVEDAPIGARSLARRNEHGAQHARYGGRTAGDGGCIEGDRAQKDRRLGREGKARRRAVSEAQAQGQQETARKGG